MVVSTWSSPSNRVSQPLDFVPRVKGDDEQIFGDEKIYGDERIEVKLIELLIVCVLISVVK